MDVPKEKPLQLQKLPDQVILILLCLRLVSKQVHKCFFSQSKTSKDVKEIFAPIKDGQYPRRILIEGAPGIGKTVLSKEISVQWANGQLLKNEILVFLIFLRDPLVQKMMSLKDFVKYYYQFDESSDSIASSCADYLLQSNGDRVTFIFDGYDEYPKNLQQKNLISDILCCRRLSNCGLVLTSRPHASVHHHHDQLFERRVEILGFTKEDRMNYITSSLEEKGAPLIKYLDSHLTISSLCFIPFNMTMLLWLYKQGVVLPNSSTELYNYFICHTICHHIAKVHAVIYGNIINLNDFEQPYKIIIQQLAFLSYKALNKSQLTFTLDEVKAACPQIDEIPGAINCFGLLQVVRYPGIMKMTTTLSFIHFSLQEFLAAYHITCLPYHDELSALKEQFMSDVHANMFSIYVGITKGMRPAFKEYLRCGTSEGLERLVIELPRSEPFGTSELAESGVAISNEFLQDKHMCLRLFKCFHEAGDKSICSRFSRAFCSSNDSIELLFNHGLYMSPLSPSDVECLVSILASKQEWQNLSLSLSDISIEILHQLLTTSTPTVYRISLYLSSNNTSSSNLIAKIVLMCKTTRLAVIGTFCTATVVNSLKENGFLRILYLYINRTEVLNEQSLQELKYNNALQQLVICGHFSCVEQCQTIGQSIKQLNRNIEVHIFQIMTDNLGLFLRTEGRFVYVPDS